MLASIKRKGRAEFYFRKEKEAIALQKRLELLSKLRWHYHFDKSNLIELPKPIRRGWINYFVVRHDFAKSNKAKILNQILPLIQNPIVCDRKDFTINRCDGKKLKKYIPMEHLLNHLYEHEYEKISEEMKSYFYSTELTRKWGGSIKVYVFKLPYMFVEKIKPHYITHTYILHNEVIAEFEYIHDKIWNSDNLGFKYLNYSSHDSDWYDWTQSKKNKLNKIKLKESKEIVNDFNCGRLKIKNKNSYYDDEYDFDYL